uniref:NADH-ubiquinone oxidoreductase chain 6 n=1 Tax=Laelia suffusa TaxID=2748665 RepID=A0A7D9MYY2_9NEOP|nr:NADH dehydrogenase subunit 6 [Laelia suffusa]UEV86537.1 NADH dehydrogenase subunit 6 [Laelia suffusa]
MTKLILSSFILSFSLIMLLMNNPLSMGLMILLQTIMTCLLSGMFIKTYWFSYILFLTFLGGLLVLFIYVSSIASNELFLTLYNKNLYMLMILFLIFIYLLMNNLFFMNLSINSDMDNMNNIYNMIYNSYYYSINLNKLYNNHTFMIMLMLMIYLLISLIAIVKITNIFYGPLRSMF